MSGYTRTVLSSSVGSPSSSTVTTVESMATSPLATTGTLVQVSEYKLCNLVS